MYVYTAHIFVVRRCAYSNTFQGKMFINNSAVHNRDVYIVCNEVL